MKKNSEEAFGTDEMGVVRDGWPGTKRIGAKDTEIKGTTIHGEQTKGVKIIEQNKPPEKQIEIKSDHE